MDVQNDFVDLDFELVVGLEVHVQLNTKSKIFCADDTFFNSDPNVNVSAVSIALPGALPKLNHAVVEKAIRMGMALNCTINQYCFFDRKNYFYADLPKGYQITQDKLPICKEGSLEVKLPGGGVKRININRIHLEEDAGKSLHDNDSSFSYVDLNRAGIPLIEIVTEPDIRTAEEAAVFLTEIRQLVRHLDVGDGNMEEGSLRCDANISIRPRDTTVFGTRCEVKNLNSIRNIRRAIDCEFRRQVEILSSGGSIIQSTLNFDADNGTTSPMREKEGANDYRYFPDPDLLPLEISDDWLQRIRNAMPPLPNVLSATLEKEYGLMKGDATMIARNLAVYRYFQEARPFVKQPKALANWLNGPVRSILNESKLDISQFSVKPVQLAEIINLIETNQVSQQNAIQYLLPAITENDNPLDLAQRLNLLIDVNNDEVDILIDQVLASFPAQVMAFKKGKRGVLGLFVGEVMKLVQGKADAKKINEKILEKLK